MKKNNLITAEQLSLKLSNQLILDRVSLKLQVGEILAIIGPNGAGKSSLINVLLGLQNFDSGKLIINKTSNDEFAFGYVSSDFSLANNSPLTVNELLEMALINCHHSAARKKQLITKSLNKVALDDFESRQFTNLSMGQKRRVLLARAIVHQPTVLFLDEPESNLDFLAITNLYQLITNLAKKEKMAVVIASHNFLEAGRIADTIVGLNKKIIFQGKKDILQKKNLIKKLYQT